MDHHLTTVIEDEYDQLEHPARTIDPQQQPSSRRVLVADLVDGNDMLDCPLDVCIGDAVTARRPMDLHSHRS